MVQLADRAFLGADTAGEIAEMVDGQRDVGIGRFAQRLAIVPGLGFGDQGQVVLDTLGDGQQDVGAFGDRSAAPGGAGGVRGIQRAFDVLGRRTRHFAQLLAVDRRQVVHVAAQHRFAPFAADEIAVALFEGCFRRDVAFELGHFGRLPVWWFDAARLRPGRRRGKAAARPRG